MRLSSSRSTDELFIIFIRQYLFLPQVVLNEQAWSSSLVAFLPRATPSPALSSPFRRNVEEKEGCPEDGKGKLSTGVEITDKLQRVDSLCSSQFYRLLSGCWGLERSGGWFYGRRWSRCNRRFLRSFSPILVRVITGVGRIVPHLGYLVSQFIHSAITGTEILLINIIKF